MGEWRVGGFGRWMEVGDEVGEVICWGIGFVSWERGCVVGWWKRVRSQNRLGYPVGELTRTGRGIGGGWG